jgi:hypothetical protein
MFNFLFCKNCHTKDDEDMKPIGPALAMLEEKPVMRKNDSEKHVRLDDHQMLVLKAYNQTHIIEAFGLLSEAQKERIIKQLGLIHFDFVDLMFHNIVLKSSNQPLTKVKNPPRMYTEIKDADFLKSKFTREDFESSLKLISEGKFAIVVTAGLSRKFGQNCAKIRIRPNWEAEDSLLELLVKRAQEIGRLATERFGKGYSKKRDPIMIFIMINTSEIEEIKTYLQSVKNFGYKGLATFGQEVLPQVRENGRLEFSDIIRSELALLSNGSGALISALKSQGVLENMKSNGVEIVQYLNLNNLLVPIADSLMIQAAHQKNLVIQVSKSDPMDHEFFPQVVFNEKTGAYEYLNRKECIEAIVDGSLKGSNFDLKTLNVYFHIDLLKDASESAETLCKYRIKEKNMAEASPKISSQLQKMDPKPGKIVYSFELPFLNVLQITQKVKFVINDPQWEAIALNTTDYSSINKYTIQEAVNNFFKNLFPIMFNWIPTEFHSRLENLTRKEKVQLFIVAGYCYDEKELMNFMKSVSNL